MMTCSNRTLWMLVAAAVATAAAYLPGLWGPFVFDDKPNLLANPFIHLNSLDWSSLRDAALSNQSGIFRRPIASLSFALNYFFAGGFSSFPFKLVNLAIHLVNGLLVFLLARRICARLGRSAMDERAGSVSDTTALVITALWMLHPLQLTSVLYVVQRMNSLSALFTLAGLVLFMLGRDRVEQGRAGGFRLMLAGIIGGGALGILCKENAALLPVYALVLELSCFDRGPLDRTRRVRLGIFFGAVLGLPAALALAYTVFNPDFVLAPYESRSFTLAERLLTQPRVLFYYVGLTLFPTRNALGIYHDDFVKSTGLFEPGTTLVAIGGWILLVGIALSLRRRAPVVFLGVAWFLCGHLMESSVFALELVHEHRNYLPVFGVLLLAVYAGTWLFERIQARARTSTVAVLLMALTLGFVTSSRAYSWSSTGVLLESLVRHHPDAPRTHGYYAEVIINNRGDIRKAFYHLQQYSRLKPDAIVGLAEMVRIANGMGLVGLPEETLPNGSGTQQSVFELPLVNHREQLDRIAREANAELERRLKAYPVSGQAVKTMVDLQNCLYRGTPVCVKLAPDLIRWMELALDNPKIVPMFRAVLLMTTAKTYSWLGQLDKAVEYAERSVETLPKDVNLSLDLVKLHLAVGNHRRGLEIIERLKRRRALLEYRGDEIRSLEARLNAGLSHSSPGG